MTVRIRANFASGGVPVNGLTPTISIWLADATSGLPLVDGEAMTEMAPDGEYSYEFTTYDPNNDYVWQVDGGNTLSDMDRYQAGSTSGLLPTEYILDIFKLTGNNVTASGDVITIYEEDGSTPWRQYNLADGGRIRV